MKRKYQTAMNEAVFYYCIGKDMKKAKIFIEQVIKRPIYKIELKNAKLLKDYMQTKEKTLDYLVLTDNGYVNIEINNYNRDWRIKRDVSYACKVLANSVTNDKDYNNLDRVIQININRLGKTEAGYEVYKLNSENNMQTFPKTLTDIIEIYIVNIDFYTEMVYNGNKKFIEENYLLCAMDLQPDDIDKISEGNEELMDFKEMLEQINDSEDFVKWDYEKDQEKIRKTIINEIRNEVFEDVKQEVKQELFEDVKQEGFEQGIEQGEKNKQIEIAKKLLENNSSIEFISKTTGLSLDEINNL